MVFAVASTAEPLAIFNFSSSSSRSLSFSCVNDLACFGDQLGLADLEQVRKFPNVRFQLLHVRERPAAGLGFDTAHTSRDAGLRHNSEQADVSRMPAVRSATEFFTERLDRHHPHLLAIFIAEEGQRAFGDRILNAHHLGRDPLVLPHLVVDDRFNLIDVAGGQRPEMGKVKPQDGSARPTSHIVSHAAPAYRATPHGARWVAVWFSLSILPRRRIDRHVQLLTLANPPFRDGPLVQNHASAPASWFP